MITIPLLLFLLLALSFWVLTDSKLLLSLRIACVVGLFTFSMIFWQNTKTFLGWAADGTVLYDMPVTLHSIVVDEPQKTKDGWIYVTVRQPPSQWKSATMRFFGHPINVGEPRLYKFKYDRRMHEELQQHVVPRFQKGQKGVRGTFKDPNAQKGEKGGDESKGDQKGEGSHSPKSKFWHDIVPKYEYDKNRAPTEEAPKTRKYLI